MNMGCFEPPGIKPEEYVGENCTHVLKCFTKSPYERERKIEIFEIRSEAYQESNPELGCIFWSQTSFLESKVGESSNFKKFQQKSGE